MPEQVVDGTTLLQRLSDVENCVLGVTAGAVEAVATQPLQYFKNARQQGLPFTLNPRLLYRGVGASAVNDGSMVGFQFLLVGMTQKLLTGGVERKLSLAEETGAAMVSGAQPW